VTHETPGKHDYFAEIQYKDGPLVRSSTVSVNYVGIEDMRLPTGTIDALIEKAGQTSVMRVDWWDRWDNEGVEKITIFEDGKARYSPKDSFLSSKQIVRPETAGTHTYQAEIVFKKGHTIKTNEVSVEFSGEVPIFSRQVYNGKLVEKVKLQTSPYLLTVERGGFSEVEEGGSPSISEAQVSLDHITPRTRVKGIVKAEKGGVDLTKSKIIVSGGRGLGKKENFQIIKDLALSLHGDYAASRPVVDNEWTEKDRQVGSSGKTVAPKLYVACGISGAIQHLSGMKKSDVIVAINKDPEAPIFGIATYGVVGDLFEIVPALISEAKKQGI